LGKKCKQKRKGQKSRGGIGPRLYGGNKKGGGWGKPSPQEQKPDKGGGDQGDTGAKTRGKRLGEGG